MTGSGYDSKGEFLRTTPRTRLYEAVEADLKLYIEQSRMEPGERLPPERELIGRLGVSRATLRQATVSLETQGMLEVRHGDGIYLRSSLPDPEVLGRLLARRHRLPEVLEARELLECRLAALAALRHDQEDLAAMERALTLMADEIAARELGTRGDEAFHGAVTAAARNSVLSHLMASLSEQIAESRFESLRESGRPRRSLAAHTRIAGAIKEGDAAKAEAAMERHLREVADVRLLRWNADSRSAEGDADPSQSQEPFTAP